MAGRKKNRNLSFTGNPERQLHTPEYSARTDTSVHGAFPDRIQMGEQIKKYRKEAKISQQSLADQLNVTRTRTFFRRSAAFWGFPLMICLGLLPVRQITFLHMSRI